MNLYPYYLVLTGTEEMYYRIGAAPGVRVGHDAGNVCIVHIEDTESRVLFEIAFGDRIVQQVTE